MENSEIKRRFLQAIKSNYQAEHELLKHYESSLNCPVCVEPSLRGQKTNLCEYCFDIFATGDCPCHDFSTEAIIEMVTEYFKEENFGQ
ncbi:hypothetical protein M0R04_09195 [Candidatus Dojkabacteria bacterium]|jgi:hypothetical protein|nr:hypothetical protein [Candidatus Dojkabacteria bacterium]